MTSPAGSTRRATFHVVALAFTTLLAHGCTWYSRPSSSQAPRRQTGTRGTIPPGFIDLVTTKRAFANLATIMPKSGPQVTPVWFDFDGKYIRVISARGRVKDRNVRRDPRVALSILDPDNPYRYLAIRGRVIEITERGAIDHINALAKKYRGVDTYRSPRPDEVRVMYVIEPRRVAGQG